MLPLKSAVLELVPVERLPKNGSPPNDGKSERRQHAFSAFLALQQYRQKSTNVQGAWESVLRFSKQTGDQWNGAHL